ncbi:hypothetical protein AZE42_06459 [Rhizopogon vesiculosus]|uniref:Uncharacterized protein n=1 Tax=Rhizopogon vesiculosus TaxID=180088 RepID=A0A1J8Q943_9AGAM|nr:hypothetical protein AZE42_06459 [Rhizopogon vesiculosus]
MMKASSCKTVAQQQSTSRWHRAILWKGPRAPSPASQEGASCHRYPRILLPSRGKRINTRASKLACPLTNTLAQYSRSYDWVHDLIVLSFALRPSLALVGSSRQSLSMVQMASIRISTHLRPAWIDPFSHSPRSIVLVTNHSAHDLLYPCDTHQDEHCSRTLGSPWFIGAMREKMDVLYAL